jgi:hypothetical protein
MAKELTKADKKELVGKRVTINGERHRVEKVLISKDILVTEDGTRLDMSLLYRKGRGFFADVEPKHGGKRQPASKKPAAGKNPTSTGRTGGRRTGGRRAAAEAEEKPTRRRTRKVKEEEVEEKPTRRRASSKKDKETDKKPAGGRRIARGEDKPAKKAKQVEEVDLITIKKFTGTNSKNLRDAFEEFVRENMAVLGYDLPVIAVGSEYTDRVQSITITVGVSDMDESEIEDILENGVDGAGGEADLDDDSLDDDLEEEEDEELDDEDSEEESDDLEDDLEEDDEDFDDEEEDEDFDDEEEDEESDDLEEEDEDEDEEGDGEEEDEDASGLDNIDPEVVCSVLSEMSKGKVGKSDSSVKRITAMVEEYVSSEWVRENLGDECLPGETVMSDGKFTGLLVGMEDDKIMFLNIDTYKFRSREPAAVIRMEIEED